MTDTVVPPGAGADVVLEDWGQSLNLVPYNLDESDVRAIAASGGSWDHVAIGTDFDGFTDPPDDCDCEAQLPRVREMLAAHGVAGADADAILGTNARRVLAAGRG